MEGPARVLLAKAYYPYTSNQRPASHACALSGAVASIPDPALSVSLRSSLGSGCARTASPRAARLLHVPVRWAAQDGGCRKKAHLPKPEDWQDFSLPQKIYLTALATDAVQIFQPLYTIYHRGSRFWASLVAFRAFHCIRRLEVGSRVLVPDRP
jgi:hypothetical protein